MALLLSAAAAPLVVGSLELAVLVQAVFGLWVLALYVMAHLIAGFPAFLRFIPLAWVSLIGHLLFGIVVAIVVRWQEGAMGE